MYVTLRGSTTAVHSTQMIMNTSNMLCGHHQQQQRVNSSERLRCTARGRAGLPLPHASCTEAERACVACCAL